MKKLFGITLFLSALSSPAIAADGPYYAGVQIGNDIVGGVFGAQLDKMYSLEVNLSNVMVPANATTTALGVAGVALFPLNIRQVPTLSVFAKVGAEYVTTTATNGRNTVNLVAGGGVQNDFSKNFSARAGLAIMGANTTTRGLYIAGLFRF